MVNERLEQCVEVSAFHDVEACRLWWLLDHWFLNILANGGHARTPIPFRKAWKEIGFPTAYSGSTATGRAPPTGKRRVDKESGNSHRHRVLVTPRDNMNTLPWHEAAGE